MKRGRMPVAVHEFGSAKSPSDQSMFGLCVHGSGLTCCREYSKYSQQIRNNSENMRQNKLKLSSPTIINIEHSVVVRHQSKQTRYRDFSAHWNLHNFLFFFRVAAFSLYGRGGLCCVYYVSAPFPRCVLFFSSFQLINTMCQYYNNTPRLLCKHKHGCKETHCQCYGHESYLSLYTFLLNIGMKNILIWTTMRILFGHLEL